MSSQDSDSRKPETTLLDINMNHDTTTLTGSYSASPVIESPSPNLSPSDPPSPTHSGTFTPLVFSSSLPPSLPETPNMSSTSLPIMSMGYFSAPFERFVKDEASEWTSALTLLDTIETYFDSRIDLLERRFKKHSDRLKMRAEEAFKSKSSDLISGTTKGAEFIKTRDIEREVQKFKIKIQTRMTGVAKAWQSAKVVRTREKISFFFGVMSLLGTSLLFGLAPEWLHIAYTLQALYLLPLRAYTYKKRAWHYFLFDLCYYATILNFIWIWLLPSSAFLWIACYCLSMGSLASAVITWRNSLVFHDQDKVTSLFIHIYAPLVFVVIRHRYPNAEERFPALKAVPHLDPVKAFLLSGLIYVIWQTLYWKFVLINRRKKIESGLRTTSFSFLLNDKRGVIGRMLSKIPSAYREAAFMGGQLLYALTTEIPPIFILYDSKFWSGVFLICIFSVSVWNGGGFYIEVFGRKFERELEALRKELAEATAHTNPHLNSNSNSSTKEEGNANVKVNAGNNAVDVPGMDATSGLGSGADARVDACASSSASSSASLELSSSSDKERGTQAGMRGDGDGDGDASKLGPSLRRVRVSSRPEEDGDGVDQDSVMGVGLDIMGHARAVPPLQSVGTEGGDESRKDR